MAETRRNFVGYILGAPVIVGVLGAILSPVLRILRPTLSPYNINQKPDEPPGGDQVVGTLAEIPEPWTYKAVYYESMNVEYTPREVNKKLIAGFAVRVSPEVIEDLRDKISWGAAFGPRAAEARDAFEKGVFVFSRICPHLGCNFNAFEPDQASRVRSDYSFPGAVDGNPYFACPCHFSVYDLKQVNDQGYYGRVVSGPAPRPPRILTFKVEGDDIIVTGMEAGGVA